MCIPRQICVSQTIQCKYDKAFILTLGSNLNTSSPFLHISQVDNTIQRSPTPDGLGQKNDYLASNFQRRLMSSQKDRGGEDMNQKINKTDACLTDETVNNDWSPKVIVKI